MESKESYDWIGWAFVVACVIAASLHTFVF